MEIEAVFHIVLVQVASQEHSADKLRNVSVLNSSYATALHVPAGFLPKLFWQLRRSVEALASYKLLSVPVKDQTPNIVFAQGERSFSGAAPSILRFPKGRPARLTGRSHQLGRKNQKQSGGLDQTGFNWAPSGRVPFSRNCQSAIKSLRANATMPMRLTRLLPLAKRLWYQRLN